MSYTVTLRERISNPLIAVVGCGGTGSFVAEGLCRLYSNHPDRDVPIILVDYDQVEKHNLIRQNFFAEDLGKFKAQVLAERLARQYGREVGYSVQPFERDMFDKPTPIGMSKQVSVIIIGCVDDSTLARRYIARDLQHFDWWLDAGNSEYSGQVLFGNSTSINQLAEGFNEGDATVTRLPAPSLQLPSLLAPPTTPVIPRDCAQEVEEGNQSPTINQAMATLVLEFMHRIARGKLDYMAQYIDLAVGTLLTVPVEPVTVARMCGVKVEYLMANRCAMGARYHIDTPVNEDEEDGD